MQPLPIALKRLEHLKELVDALAPMRYESSDKSRELVRRTEMSKSNPMTRSQLHEIAVRRRGDADVKALLLEIKRLHGVLVRAHELTGHLVKHDGELTARQPVERLLELLETEPAVDEQPRPTQGKTKRPEPEQRFPHLTEREEKRLARDKRG